MHAEIIALKESAMKREDELEERVNDLRQHVLDADEEAKSAKVQVQEALRLARAQGLAKSFQDRSVKLNSERRAWTLGFLGAGTVLLLIGIVFVNELDHLTYERLFIALLKKAALVAPAIWVGWYCARQVSRVGKIQEDYEYKAASALAYQSYKEEAAHSPDGLLSAQLLGRAIETFGENPVRLYDGPKTEVHSPLEDLLSKMKPEKLTELLAAALSKSLEK